MSEEPELTSVSNPQRFIELAMTEDPQERLDSLQRPEDAVLCEIIRYGIYNDARMISGLQRLYEEIFIQMPVERRRAIYRHIADMVESINCVSANAFLPFITEDNA